MAPIQSVSYYDKESSLTPAYMRRVDIEFQKLGLRGVTIVVCCFAYSKVASTVVLGPLVPVINSVVVLAVVVMMCFGLR